MAADITSTRLTSADINTAKAAVDTYVATCNDIFQKLSGIISSLTAPKSDFNGDSSVGYNEFFASLTPVLVDQLTGPDNSMTSALKNLLTQIEQALLNTVDPSIGNQNRNLSGGAAVAE